MSELMQPIDRWVQVGAVNLHYLDWGTSGQPPVLLLYGGA